MQKSRVVLVILDGWGIGPDYAGNAIHLAKTPTMTMLSHTYPHTELIASGESVGLPKGEDGNTETGHLNIGAGRIVYQDLPRINMSISSGSFLQNKAFLKAAEHVRKNNSNIHLLGLVGQGGVHSSNEHLYALLRFCKEQKLDKVFLHLITDGRDSGPVSSPMYLAQVAEQLSQLGVGKVATLVGRYYAMDRDHRWERIQVAYDALISGKGETVDSYLDTLNARHVQKENDEFIKPIIIKDTPRIGSNDAVIFFNYRIDRPRELTRAITMPDADFVHHSESFDPYGVKYHKSHLKEMVEEPKIFARPNRPENLCFVSMTEYEKNLPVDVAFPPEFVEMPLSRVIALDGRRQLKLAESEKERFVTYYFNGQRELKFPGEDIDITPSPKVPTYDLMPEMSGVEQTKKLCHAIDSELYDFIVINYPNPDMVAHTGNLEASIKACEFTDSFITKVYERVMQKDNVTMLITADHGNVEELISLENGGIDTEHSGFPVPLLVVGRPYLNQAKSLSRGILADVAPTILKILGINKPSSMSGRSLL